MENHDLVILGAGCAGLSAGIYAASAGLETLILDTAVPGGQAAVISEVSNYPGVPDISGAELVRKMLHQAEAFGAEVYAAPITGVSLLSTPKRILTPSGSIAAKSVIIASGALPRRAGFGGEVEFRGRGISSCAACDGALFRGKEIFVVGGGCRATEEAVYLTRFGNKVTVLVRGDRLRCSRAAADRLMQHQKITVRFNTELIRVYGNGKLRGAVIKNKLTGGTETIEPDGGLGVFVYVGLEPDTSLFQGQVKLDENGYIDTDEFTHTDIPGVFAAGDIRRKPLHQIVTAASDGAVAAAEAEKFINACN